MTTDNTDKKEQETGLVDTPIRREVRSSRHSHFTAEDHERMKATLDSLSNYPTEEEAEAVLQACGTSGKEVVNEFIERLLKENLELKQALVRRAAVAAPQGDDLIKRQDAISLARTHDKQHSSGYRCYEGEAIADKIAALPAYVPDIRSAAERVSRAIAEGGFCNNALPAKSWDEGKHNISSSPAAPSLIAEQQEFKNTKEAMLYAQRQGIPTVIPAATPSAATAAELNALQSAYNQGIEDAKYAIRATVTGGEGDQFKPYFINQIARTCSPHRYTGGTPPFTETEARDEIVDEVQRRMDQVVEAAVEWHQAGREGGEWLEAAEKLGAAIDSLLELRDKAITATECFCGTELEAGLCPNGHDPISVASPADTVAATSGVREAAEELAALKQPPSKQFSVRFVDHIQGSNTAEWECEKCKQRWVSPSNLKCPYCRSNEVEPKLTKADSIYNQAIDDAIAIISKHFPSAVPVEEQNRTRLRWLLTQIISDLPAKRDWLDPELEREARELTGIKSRSSADADSLT